MTNTNTNDVEATVSQVESIVAAGADMVRISVPTIREIDPVQRIFNQLKNNGVDVPLIADVHFNPKVAEKLTSIVDKIRINPGNYTDKRVFDNKSEDEFKYLKQKMAERAKPLFQLCNQHNTAIRVGVNHGSLADRIVSKYGNGAEGMVESAMEWMDIAQQHNFQHLVISLKTSNPFSMIDANLLLKSKMRKRNMYYPIHLGVTEAGSDMEGRAKSAVGIGTLLLMGIGDTIRVSLTEKPENEISFARRLVKVCQTLPKDHYTIDNLRVLTYHYDQKDEETFLAEVAAVCGYEHYHQPLSDIKIENSCFSAEKILEMENVILQACRIKMNKTEIISCPTCARTDYDIEAAIALVKERFSDFPGLKLAVMGCIVNGPGEMADAHFGIVGTGKQQVIVYKGKQRISSNVSLQEAMNILEKLITYDT
jgi:(E)-4-hydroxy-3-methylbut-2-enyl-diphosphate synthase